MKNTSTYYTETFTLFPFRGSVRRFRFEHINIVGLITEPPGSVFKCQIVTCAKILLASLRGLNNDASHVMFLFSKSSLGVYFF